MSKLKASPFGRNRQRAVPIVHRGIGLAPRLRGFAHLEGGLVCQADGPARAATRAMLAWLMERTDVTVCSSHDPVAFAKLGGHK